MTGGPINEKMKRWSRTITQKEWNAIFNVNIAVNPVILDPACKTCQQIKKRIEREHEEDDHND